MKHAFEFGEWLVDPSANTIENADGIRQTEPRTMDVLLALCNARGAVLSTEQLLEQCWGSTMLGDSPVHKNIANLRRLLGDNARTPAYIETIRMRGYRTVAPLDFNARSSAKAWAGGSPFRGLLPFDAMHADVFFGRDEVIRQLHEAVAEQVRAGYALTMVLGPSGTGKTSLIQAGLLPLLEGRRAAGAVGLLASTTFALLDQGEQTLFTALAGALLDLQWGEQLAFPGESAISLGLRLERDSGAVIAALAAHLAAQAPRQDGLRFGIFLDGFEALFNASRIAEAERLAFLNTLDQLARSRAVLLIVACRNDFYPSIARYPSLTEGRRHGGHFDLRAPGFSDIAQIIRRPAAAARLTFGVDPATGARLDDMLCESASASPDALPLLQYCLHELYRLRTPEGELSFEAFHQLGDLEGAIGLRAERVVLAMTEAQRATLPHLMSLVTVLSTDGDTVTSQRAPCSALRGESAQQALAALVESRLFISDLAGSTPVFGIAHDAILRRWPRMTDWIATHRNALRARGPLAQQAARWRDEGRPADLLLPRGKPLSEALEVLQGGVLALTEAELELIGASRQRARQRELVRWAALTLIVVLSLLASLLGVSAIQAKRSAEQRRNEAESLMHFMLGDFADKLRPLGRLDFLESVSGKALQYLNNSPDQTLNPTALTLRAKGLQVIAEVSRSRGDSARALDALTQASAILMSQHRATPHDTQVLKALGDNAYWVGQMHKDQNNLAAAETAWRDYLRFADLLHERDPDNPEWWVEQSYAHNNLGSLAITRGQPALAVPDFLQSIALKRRALDRAPQSHTVAADLAASYSWLASAREALGELQEARQLYAKELELVAQLHERLPGDAMWVHRHVVALQHRAMLAAAMGQDAEALRDYDEAQRMFTHIAAQDGKNRAWQVELASLEQERLRLLARTRPPQQMLAPLGEVHQTLEAILALDPKNSSWERREAIARTRLAAGLLASGQVAAARRQADTAGQRLRALYQDNPNNFGMRVAWLESLLLWSAIEEASGARPASVRASCEQVRVVVGDEIKTTMNHQLLDPWVRANLCLHDSEAIEPGVKRLSKINYRDQSYVQFLSTHL
ncbi:nSTAND1 domain-containing NTPase [Duganella sp. S19_KUP01_CR8]|uniref:nSTAND1 domain-containing NTPase n=1 Tax=Duganella sp. S19_KUP01_CR8 TaxID=3025502 RepID=UPI002FCD9884